MTSKWLDRPWLALGCRVILGAVFVYASWDKILNPAEFAKSVFNYQILPVVASNLVAMSLPWLELFAGLALIVGVLKVESSLLVNGLLVIFIVAISIALVRGVDIDCGCFGAGGGDGRRIGLLTLFQDLALVGAGWIALRAAVREQRVGQA